MAGPALPGTLNPTRDVLAPAAVRLAQGQPLSQPRPRRHRALRAHQPPGAPARQPHDRPRGARGPLRQPDYQHLARRRWRRWPGPARRPCTSAARRCASCGPHFAAAPPGEIVCTFNPQGFLCVAINQGHASELLGLYFDSQVDVRFAG
ncbi:MAG: SAM hydroxide adenosyltransferase [Hymenobacter sp.]